jgi:hypothetical protein
MRIIISYLLGLYLLILFSGCKSWNCGCPMSLEDNTPATPILESTLNLSNTECTETYFATTHIQQPISE